MFKKFIDEPKMRKDYNYKLFTIIHHNRNINEEYYYSLINIENKWWENDYNSTNACILLHKKLN